MTAAQEELPELVDRYCRMIEATNRLDPGQLSEIQRLLKDLQSAVSLAGEPGSERPEIVPVDLDARFELYSHLHELLGNQDAYCLQPHVPGGELAKDEEASPAGSLADDLTDIYCELKQGLKLLDEAPRRAMDCWLHGFHLHWGLHLEDATRHLARLQNQEPVNEM